MTNTTPEQALRRGGSAAWKDKAAATRTQLEKQRTKTIVPEDSSIELSRSRQIASKIILSPKFDAFIACVVVANSITMGLESEVPSWRQFFVITDAIFVFIYTVELLLRLHVSGMKLFRMAANILDLIIVVAGWASLMVDLIGSDGESLRMLTTLKVLRAFRSIRLLRMFTFFEGCWIIAASFFSCLKPLAWTCLFLTIVLFTFTMFAIELIGKGDAFDGIEEREDFMRTHMAFFTLFQITTLDEWRYVVQPLCNRQGWAYIFFVIYLAITAMSLMNLVTAVVVDSSMKRTLNEEEYKRTKERRQRDLEGESIKEFMDAMEEQEMGARGSGARGSLAEQRQRKTAASVDFTTQSGRVTMVQQDGKALGGHQILDASAKWRGIEKIFDAFEIEDPADVEKIMASMDDNGDGILSVSEMLDGLLDLRQITEDKHRLALIQACDTSESRCEIVSRCLRDVRAPEDCVRTLRSLEEKLGKHIVQTSRRPSAVSMDEAQAASPLTRAINKEIDLLEGELKKQRQKISQQKRQLNQLRDAVFELNQNLAFENVFLQNDQQQAFLVGQVATS